MSLASSISASIAKEKRSGEIILTAHGVRLAILLALLELAWFSGTQSQPLTTSQPKYNRQYTSTSTPISISVATPQSRANGKCRCCRFAG
ncbi:hypothetical protein F5148DRAFT_1238775 [Russula earlei]|uniref:Uncharacterized protein n=1 Tax=Russula earlei TaxID=71964 RepID=A0ACC0TWA9_9AGAM|nr:hypothetical protein F5148DRAFT_1238775 [Russula earlei]